MNLKITYNKKKLLEAQKKFLKFYPKGFLSPEIQMIAKKHNLAKTQKLIEDCFKKKSFQQPETICTESIKIMNSSSMISLFDKPKYRDFIKGISVEEKILFSQGLYKLYFGDEKKAYDQLIEIMGDHKIARWPIISLFKAYKNLDYDVFIKPSTTKLIIKELDLDITYKAKPSYEFYREYREIINFLKTQLDPRLSPNNPAFTGFLMMTLGQ